MDDLKQPAKNVGLLNMVNEELNAGNGLSNETATKLLNEGVSFEQITDYVNGYTPSNGHDNGGGKLLNNNGFDENQIIKEFGGQDKIDVMREWAQKNLSSGEIADLNKQLKSGDENLAYAGMGRLTAKYNNSQSPQSNSLLDLDRPMNNDQQREAMPLPAGEGIVDNNGIDDDLNVDSFPDFLRSVGLPEFGGDIKQANRWQNDSGYRREIFRKLTSKHSSKQQQI